MGSRPVPVPIMTELKKYISGLDAKQENLFNMGNPGLNC